MKNISLFIVFIFSFLSINATEKYALIVAIGDYPSKTGWSTISSKNDVPLIKQTLLNQGFNESNITILIDEQATKRGILLALQKLMTLTEEGDVVVFHVSAHGQQIMDENGDEIDELDEAIIPYDAWAKYTYKYKGENHLRDDELGIIIANFRNKLGKTGQLLFLLDSCHSGSTTRGGKARGSRAAFVPDGWIPKKSGVGSGSDMFEKVKLSENASPFILISGASANQLNYEHEGVGSLSYSFSKAMNELGTDFTYRQLFSKIESIMNVITPNQTPTVEGDIDYKLFKGEYVSQQPYFEVASIPRKNIIKIRAGKLQGLFKNTTVNILPSGTSNFKEELVVAKGVITNSKFNEAIITLDRQVKESNVKLYWVFVDQASYGDISLKVFFDLSVDDESLQKDISKFLNKNNLGDVVTDTLQTDIIISKDYRGSVILSVVKDKMVFAKLENQKGKILIDSIQEKLFNFAQGQYLKNLNIKNKKYEFDFKLLPVEYDDQLDEITEIISDSLAKRKSSILKVRPNNDRVVLQVSNKTNRPIYFSIIEINSKGEINPFLPNSDCALTNEERKLAAGKTKVIDCVFQFDPPYEKLMLKGFATNTPINFQQTVKSRGKNVRGKYNPLEKFLSKTYTKTRGSSGQKISEKIDGYSNEFIYEIIKE